MEGDSLRQRSNSGSWVSSSSVIGGVQYEQKSTCQSHVGLILACTLTILVVIAVTVAIAIGWIEKNQAATTTLLSTAVTANECQNLGNHLNSLQAVANDSNNSRSVKTGYSASADYVLQQLRERTNCEISIQNFTSLVYTEIDSPTLSLIEPFQLDFQVKVDFGSLRNGGNGSYLLFNKSICIIPNGGCNSSDYPPEGLPADCIALIQLQQTNDCLLIDKALAAERANAKAVIIYNNAARTSLITNRVMAADGWYAGYPTVSIPVLSGSYSLGITLSQLGESAKLDLTYNAKLEMVPTFNVFCVTKEGNPDSAVVFGAHLDSVPEGPGLNDNGSGSSTLLETAIQWYALGLKPVNQIRFCWWGSEEVGLLGSRYFVRDLQTNHPTELAKIALYLNFDMLASPNYYLGIHDGSTASSAQNGSSVITSMFEEYFDNLEVPYKLIELVSGSDFVPFISANIPSGGLAAGASGMKSEEDRTSFGGYANAPYDPCYHLSCDTYDNINFECLNYLAGAAAYVIQKTAQMQDLRGYLHTPNSLLKTRQFDTYKSPVETCEVD